jgi:hypothetical protein
MKYCAKARDIGMNIGYDDKTNEETVMTALLDLQIDSK